MLVIFFVEFATSERVFSIFFFLGVSTPINQIQEKIDEPQWLNVFQFVNQPSFFIGMKIYWLGKIASQM